MDDTKQALSWEDQVECALAHNIDAAYECFMALDMDKDKVSHGNINMDTWSKLSKMVADHEEIMQW